ncbi:hypothetical protein P3S68_032824 [Capsicum galapagoense]
MGSSSMNSPAETPNRRNRITMISEPLETGHADDIENNVVSIDWARTELDEPNILLYDTLSIGVDKIILNAVKDYIVDGFQWGSQEGPFCDEPIRNVKFRIVDALIAPESSDRGMSEIRRCVQHATHSAFLLAMPRFMEPVYYVEIQTSRDYVDVIGRLLACKRGAVISTAEAHQPGTLSVIKAHLPVIESFGFNEALKEKKMFWLSVFDHWAIIPRDPLDNNIVLRPSEPTPTDTGIPSSRPFDTKPST